MGQLIEKLQRIGQGPSGSLGFMPRRDNGDHARPAAVLVTLRAQDTVAAEAAIKSGVDAIIITGWNPGVNVADIKKACQTGQTLWGVRYDGAGEDEPVKAARDAGAGFLVLGDDAAVSPLFEDLDKFDRVVTIAAPTNEMDLLTLRALSALPAQAALLALPVGVAGLAALPASAFARLAIIAMSLRFPALAAVDDVPDLPACHALVRLGIDGIVLAGVGVETSVLGKQIAAVRGHLEKVPPLSGLDHVSLNSMPGSGPARSGPEPKPDGD